MFSQTAVILIFMTEFVEISIRSSTCSANKSIRKPPIMGAYVLVLPSFAVIRSIQRVDGLSDN